MKACDCVPPFCYIRKISWNYLKAESRAVIRSQKSKSISLPRLIWNMENRLLRKANEIGRGMTAKTARKTRCRASCSKRKERIQRENFNSQSICWRIRRDKTRPQETSWGLLAAADGIEPPSPGSEPGILPMNDAAIWCVLRDSNPGPARYERAALTI